MLVANTEERVFSMSREAFAHATHELLQLALAMAAAHIVHGTARDVAVSVYVGDRSTLVDAERALARQLLRAATTI